MRVGPFARPLVVACLAGLLAGCSSAGGAQPSAASGTPAGGAEAAATASPAGAVAPDAGSPADSQAPGGAADGSQGGRTVLCAANSLDRLAAAVGAVGAPDHPGDSSDLYGMGCRSFTVYGKGGVVIQRMPVKLGYDDLASMDGQHPVSVVVAPPPSDDVALALLRDLIAATK